MSSFFINLYIRIKPDWLCLTSAGDSIQVEFIPRLAVNEEWLSVEGIGKEIDEIVASQHIHKRKLFVLEGFNDTENIVSSPDAAVKLLQHSVYKYLTESQGGFEIALLLRRVRLILHPLHKLKPDAEKHAAKTLYDVTMATRLTKKVYVWFGRELWKNEIEKLSFPTDGLVYTKHSFKNMK